MDTRIQVGNDRVRFLDDEEWKRLLDEQTRAYLSVSADDFLASVRAGRYGDLDDDPRLMWLAMLVPDVWLRDGESASG